MPQPVLRAADAAGDQFYVTHCTTADSVLNNPGYAVRAASTTDPGALDAALHYPPYELPIDMWRDLPPVELAPRRLARTEHPDGGVWVVQSAYLAKDTVGRDRSYFSHLLLLPHAEPADVLRSWGAGEWVASYPQGETKSLEEARLPTGSLVSDEALTEYLGENPSGPLELGVTVCPERLRDSADRRRELFARMLQAMLVFATEENPARRRLYAHAEPGLLALLLYGAVRLLPPTVTDNLTFSTFEPYHRNLREYKRAEVVGTYLGSPDRGLDPDLGTARGIALDAFNPARSSPELRRPLSESLPDGVNELIELAKRGEWHLLPSVQKAMGADPEGLANAGQAIARARGLARVDAGEANIDDLLALQADRLAAGELRARSEGIWPVVKAAAFKRVEVRTAFRELLAEPDRVRELWEEAVEAVLKEDFRKWDARWSVIRAAAGAGEARRYLAKLVGSEKNEGKLAKLSTDSRTRLRTACADVGLMPSRALLVPNGLGELEPLLTGNPEWAGYSACVILAGESFGWLVHVPPSNRERMRERARQFILAAPPEALASYVRAARPHLDADTAFLDVLFTPYSEGAARLMDRLLGAGTLEPADWLKLCASVGLTQDEWGDYLLEKDRLASLLVGLGADGVGKDVWGAYLGLLTPALVSPDLIETEDDGEPQVIHDWERKVHTHLKLAAERLTAAGKKLAPALPEGGVGRLFAANNLLKWVNDPASADRDGADEVAHACAAYQVAPHDLVRVAFQKGGFARCEPATDPKSLAPVVALFQACFPVDAAFDSARRAASEAIRLSRAAPDAKRGALQALLIHSCVPDLHFRSLLDSQWREPLHPFAVARLNEWAARTVKKGGAKYAPPVAAAQEAVVVEDEPPPEAASEEFQDGDEPRGEKKPKAKKAGCGVFVLALALAAIGAAVAWAG